MSAQAKHTPGPWRVQGSGWAHLGGPSGGTIEAANSNHGTYYIGRDGTLVCTQSSGPSICHYYTTAAGIDEQAGMANGRLIAAAPELLEALTEIIPFVDDAEDVSKFFPESACTNRCREAVRKVRAVLAKVAGERA